MTIQEFKRVFGYLNIKFKKALPDDYIITNEDIIKGNIIQKYVYSNNLTGAINGFTVMENEICYIYNNIDNIEINTDEIFPPCGGKMEVNVYAIYTVHKVDSTGNDSLLEANKKSRVNAIIKLDNSEFTYDKSFIIKKTPNSDDENVECNISASYYYKGRKYEDDKKIIQTTNSISSWRLETESTTSIKIKLSSEEIGNNGGIITANVERFFTRIYYKLDSCGNKVGGKSEPNHVEDITDKCLISSSDKEHFLVNKNIISVRKQEIGANKRSSIITAKFFGFESSVELWQKEGGKITYEYELSFDGGSKNNFLDLETSLKKEIQIPIISKKNVYIDNIYNNSFKTTNLSVLVEDEWLNAYITSTDENVYLSIGVKEENLDKEHDRESIIAIKNNDDESKIIKLIVSQPQLSVIKEDLYCAFYGSGEYTSDELDNAELYFKLYKRFIFENGTFELEEHNKKIDFKAFYKSTNNKFLNVSNVIYDNNKYVVKLDNASKFSMNDIILEIKLNFENEKVESDIANITVKGNIIIKNKYEFCFENKNIFENVKWKNNKKEKIIKLKSLKHILTNGIETDTKYMPFKIMYINEKGKETFDDKFSIRVVEDGLAVFPYKVNEPVSKTYTLLQIESGLIIKLKLEYGVSETKYDIPLKVLVCSKNITNDIYTVYGGYALIDNDYKIKLNPCWLSPTMIDNFDVAYDGNIELEEGEHTIETFNISCVDSIKNTHKEVKLKENIFVNNTKNPIVLSIEV